MKKYFYFLLLISLLSLSCSSNSTKKEPESVMGACPDTSSDIDVIRRSVQLNPLDGYFSVYRPSATTAYILDESNFSKNFHPATTMDNRPRVIDFSVEEVGAIVLPETQYDTEIILDSAYVTERIMHIIYKVNEGVEKRSFSTIPVKLFTFDLDLNVDSISFENAGINIIVPNIH